MSMPNDQFMVHYESKVSQKSRTWLPSSLTCRCKITSSTIGLPKGGISQAPTTRHTTQGITLLQCPWLASVCHILIADPLLCACCCWCIFAGPIFELYGYTSYDSIPWAFGDAHATEGVAWHWVVQAKPDSMVATPASGPSWRSRCRVSRCPSPGSVPC